MTTSEHRADSNAAMRTPHAIRPHRGGLIIDAPTRLFHWLFALSFAGAYITAESERLRLIHISLGYTLAGLLAFRLAWGLLGPKQVHLSGMANRLRPLVSWLQKIGQATKQSPAYWRQGINLLTASSIVALLLAVIPLTLSGYATYEEWGGEWLEETHELFANLMLTMVAVHLGALLMKSLLNRRNAALPMITGKNPEASKDLVANNRTWLAACLLGGVLLFWGYQWTTQPASSFKSQETQMPDE